MTPNPPSPTPEPDCVLPGDVDDSSKSDIVDALLVAQYYVNIQPEIFIKACANLNQDGKIDIVDAFLIARCYLGLPCFY
ncbi:MAG: hypothetical protein JXR70_15800 [Spirochaetales bacterium]|nr:hypothetical protein [Spirochaetales bacterium]